MKYRILIFTILSLFSTKMISQTTEIINPKGKWFFGAEIGTNTITSAYSGSKTSLQGGVLAEYYFAKNWSFNGRIKYIDTALNTSLFSKKLFFEGALISVPLNIVWKFRIIKNFGGNIKLGLALNQEVKSIYYPTANEKTDYSKFYTAINFGYGLNYFISNKAAIYLNIESFVFDKKIYNSNRGVFDSFLLNKPVNNLINIGYKYNFKKEKLSK